MGRIERNKVEQLGTWHLAHITDNETGVSVTAFKVILDEERLSLEASSKAITTFMGSINVVNSVVLNRNDLLEACVSFGASVLKNEISEHTGRLHMLDLSRRLANLQSMFRSFLDHYDRLFVKRYGRGSKQHNDWKLSLSAEYDNEICYRIVYAMRNYIQHCDMPPLTIHSHQSIDIEGAEIRIDVNLLALMEDAKFSSKFREANLPDNMSLSEIIQKWDDCFQRIWRKSLKVLAAELAIEAKALLSVRSAGNIGDTGRISPIFLPHTTEKPTQLQLSIRYLPENDARFIIETAADELIIQ